MVGKQLLGAEGVRDSLGKRRTGGHLGQNNQRNKDGPSATIIVNCSHLPQTVLFVTDLDPSMSANNDCGDLQVSMYRLPDSLHSACASWTFQRPSSRRTFHIRHGRLHSTAASIACLGSIIHLVQPNPGSTWLCLVHAFHLSSQLRACDFCLGHHTFDRCVGLFSQQYFPFLRIKLLPFDYSGASHQQTRTRPVIPAYHLNPALTSPYLATSRPPS